MMLKRQINNLKIDDNLYQKILIAIKYVVKYQSCRYFTQLGFRRFYPSRASGSYFFRSKKFGLIVKSSFLMEVVDNFEQNKLDLLIPTIILTYNEYPFSVSEWIIQPIANLKNQKKDYEILKKKCAEIYFYDFFKPHCGNWNGKSVIFDW